MSSRYLSLSRFQYSVTHPTSLTDFIHLLISCLCLRHPLAHGVNLFPSTLSLLSEFQQILSIVSPKRTSDLSTLVLMAILLSQSLEQLLNETYHFHSCPCQICSSHRRQEVFTKLQKSDHTVLKGIKDLSEIAVPTPLSYLLCFCSLSGFPTTNKLQVFYPEVYFFQYDSFTRI